MEEAVGAGTLVRVAKSITPVTSKMTTGKEAVAKKTRDDTELEGALKNIYLHINKFSELLEP